MQPAPDFAILCTHLYNYKPLHIWKMTSSSAPTACILLMVGSLVCGPHDPFTSSLPSKMAATRLERFVVKDKTNKVANSRSIWNSNMFYDNSLLMALPLLSVSKWKDLFVHQHALNRAKRWWFWTSPVLKYVFVWRVTFPPQILQQSSRQQMFQIMLLLHLNSPCVPP